MSNRLKQFSGFVCELRARAGACSAQELAHWAVEDLADSIGFDAAWYGWAKLGIDNVTVHASASIHLPDDYYKSWCEMSDQDLLAAGVRENPDITSIYNRNGNYQTEGMASLADAYGITRMATAMHERPNRTTSFYLSSYRTGHHASPWSQEELEYLKCAVDQLSDAMSFATKASPEQQAASSTTLFTNRDGVVIIGLGNLPTHLTSQFPDWQGDQLPPCLRNLIDIPGEHILVDRQLVLRFEPVPGTHNMDLHKLTLRPLTQFDLLTQRQQEIALDLARGKSHKETARALGVAPSTVRNQIQSIYQRIGITSRAELASVVNNAGRG